MSEAYKVIYSIDKNLYVQGSPVIIAEGGLIRDIKKGNMFCQFRLVNVSSKTIKAVRCNAVTDFGAAEGGVDGIVCARNMDIIVNIGLQGYDHSRVSLEVTDIEFTDSTHWTPAPKALWEKLTGAVLLEYCLPDNDHVREFKNRFEEAVYYPVQEKDLWYCCCGAVNRSDESACHKCSRSLATLKKFAEEELPRIIAREKRLEAIHKKTFEEAYNNVLIDKKAKRNRGLIYILIAIAIITIVALLIASDGTHYTQAI